MTHQTVFDPTKLFSYTVRTTKEGVQHGPLRVFRAMATPADSFGRNGDVAIVDDTAEEDRRQAIDRVPETVRYCQKIPLVITPGTFTIDDGVNPAFTITINGLDDVIDQINLANIPGFRAFLRDRGRIVLHGIPVTIADGTSDWPSVSGVAGLTAGGEIEVNTGTWFCFATGGVGVEDEGILVGQFSVLNFIGAGVTATDGGGGTADITVTGGAGGVAYGSIAGDVGTATATVASELITFGGTGITITATNAGAGLDTLSFDLDIADLPAGIPPPIAASTLAINVGGTTAEYPISSLSGLFTSIAYSSITGGDGGTATAIGSDTITVNGTGINVTATDAGAGLDTLDLLLDIADLSAGAGPLVASDEIAVDDGGTTERHSLTDAVAAVLPGLAETTINGQILLTLVDTTRGNKILSVTDHPLLFADNDLSDLEWMEIGDANNADSSYVADLDGTVVMATGHCEDTGGNSKEIHLYINGVDSVTLGTLSGGANATFTNTTINVNFTQGQRIRARAHNGSGGEIDDTVVKVTLKWRG